MLSAAKTAGRGCGHEIVIAADTDVADAAADAVTATAAAHQGRGCQCGT
ncbi:hypothetical protein LJR290_007048 [Variovorax sp. LjRoot290]